jgi:hypothetical protein
VLPSALVPGSRVKSTGTPRQSRLSLPYIGGAPGGRWVSQQRHSFQPSAAGERRTKARRALGPAARGRIAGDISLRAAESVVESPAQLPLHASSHAANRHPAPSTQHPAPSTQHPAPSTQHTQVGAQIAEGEREKTASQRRRPGHAPIASASFVCVCVCVFVFVCCTLRLLGLVRKHTHIRYCRDEGDGGLRRSPRRPRPGACRPLRRSRPEPLRRHGPPLGAVVCTAATNGRPGPRSRGL